MKEEHLEPGWCPDCGKTPYDIKKGKFVCCSKCGRCKGIDTSEPLTEKERKLIMTHHTTEDGWNLNLHADEIDEDEYKNIKANTIDIGDNVEISDDVEIICDRLVIGEGTVITGGTKIMCKNCHIGKNNFINGAWIEAALNAGNTSIHIGNECLILQGARLNCNGKLVIGSDVNIGQNVEIWTHASSMDVFNGYPYVKSPVTIGNHVWITAGTTIMPGTTVGNHIIIGNKSIVNKDLPDGCFAAGAPVKIIKEKCFPKKLDFKNKEEILLDCITEYTKLLDYKPFNAILQQKANSLTIIMWAEDRGITYFDLENRCMHGDINECSEDFRDFLRYRGIKIFTGKPFKSIKPSWYTLATKKKGLFK